MPRLDLNGAWSLHFGPQQVPASALAAPDIPAGWPCIDAVVPGNVELDLIRAGRLPGDLDHAHNIYLLRDWECHQWWYRRSFNLEAADLPAGRHELVFEGLDTLGTAWLNGARIGSPANMLVPHRFDVSTHLREGENELIVAIDSAVMAARQRPVDAGTWAMENNWESLHLRKAAHGFGWDIMPRVISAGLWRDVYLETLPAIRFRDVYVATTAADPEKRTAHCVVRWDLATDVWPMDGWSVRFTVGTTGGAPCVLADRTEPVLCSHGQLHCPLADVELWWPRGAGAPYLHDLELTLIAPDGSVHARWSHRFGFRTIRLEKTATLDADGDGRFVFVVNGVDTFVKGTNWVPLDALHSRDAARLAETHAMLVDLNCNMVRCWGGNVYETAQFFRLCDEAGIMVWQDFAFACALYPQTREFHAVVAAEARSIIPLLRNHCSLALWAGNNEIDAFYPLAKPHADPNVDDQISRVVLAGACRELDPWRDYLPSSPYFSPELCKLGTLHDRRPEDHLWGPRDDFKGAYYTSSRAHFASEIGYHGCPARGSLERMMSPESLWPWQENEEWLTHAVRPLRHGTAYNYRIPLMAHQIEVLFGEVPAELDDFIFASQVSQAEALKFFIERFRIAKGRRSGILWWNLRDGWPIISDAIVDYYGERKLAYAVIKRLQADVCVMLGEAVDGSHRVVAVNGTLDPVELSIRIDNQGTRLFAESLALGPNSGTTAGFVRASDVPAFYGIGWKSGKTTGRNHYISGLRPFDLSDCRQWFASEFPAPLGFIETGGAKVEVTGQG